MSKRVKVRPALKQQLTNEAGGKCANPGCAKWRLHIHHIKHWAVYKAHNDAHMIAICPSCHDEVHHGRLPISDDDLYRWKGVQKPRSPDYFQMFVEPAAEQMLLLGAFCVKARYPNPLLAQLTADNSIGFRIIDRRFLQVSIRMHAVSGRQVLHVTDNIVQVPHSDDVTFDVRDGKVRVTVPATDEFVPAWLGVAMLKADPSYGSSGRVIALELEVLRPGLVRVQGYWPSVDEACVITDKFFVWATRTGSYPLIIASHGSGEETVLEYGGDFPPGVPMFSGIYQHKTMQCRAAT